MGTRPKQEFRITTDLRASLREAALLMRSVPHTLNPKPTPNPLPLTLYHVPQTLPHVVEKPNSCTRMRHPAIVSIVAVFQVDPKF